MHCLLCAQIVKSAAAASSSQASAAAGRHLLQAASSAVDLSKVRPPLNYGHFAQTANPKPQHAAAIANKLLTG